MLQLQERWQPAPLLLLPVTIDASRDQLLTLTAEGLLQNGDSSQLQEAITTLLQGGRIVQLQTAASPSEPPPLGLAQSLLLSGLQQISNDLQVIEALLNPPEGVAAGSAAGRTLPGTAQRPFAAALVVGPPAGGAGGCRSPASIDGALPSSSQESTAITLRQRNALAVWHSIRERLDGSVQSGLSNATGRLLAIEGLHPDRRRELLLALLQQLDQVLGRLRQRIQAPLIGRRSSPNCVVRPCRRWPVITSRFPGMVLCNRSPPRCWPPPTLKGTMTNYPILRHADALAGGSAGAGERTAPAR